jgi:hypothetical protein
MIRHPSAHPFCGDNDPVSFTVAVEDSCDFTATVAIFDAHDITAAKTAEQGVRGNADNIVLGFGIHSRRASTSSFSRYSEACILDLGCDPCGAREFPA